MGDSSVSIYSSMWNMHVTSKFFVTIITGDANTRAYVFYVNRNDYSERKRFLLGPRRAVYFNGDSAYQADGNRFSIFDLSNMNSLPIVNQFIIEDSPIAMTSNNAFDTLFMFTGGHYVTYHLGATLTRLFPILPFSDPRISGARRVGTTFLLTGTYLFGEYDPKAQQYNDFREVPGEYQIWNGTVYGNHGYAPLNPQPGNFLRFSKVPETVSIEQRPSLAQGQVVTVTPNPLTPTTTIRFQGTGKSHIRIYDLNGHLIRTWNSTTGSVIWNGQDLQGRDVASGTYIVRVNVGERVMSRRIVLMR